MGNPSNVFNSAFFPLPSFYCRNFNFLNYMRASKSIQLLIFLNLHNQKLLVKESEYDWDTMEETED